jgi:hypothetical protein
MSEVSLHQKLTGFMGHVMDGYFLVYGCIASLSLPSLSEENEICRGHFRPFIFITPTRAMRTTFCAQECMRIRVVAYQILLTSKKNFENSSRQNLAHVLWTMAVFNTF